MVNHDNLQWHLPTVTKEERTHQKQQKPCVVWFTGLSGSGKSTLSNCLETLLHRNGNYTYLLDGDNIRHGLNRDLGFDEISRIENIRRIGEVCKLFVESGDIVLAAFISPFANDRHMARSLFDYGEFIEVFVDAPLEVCEKRDTKGLYAKARQGVIKEFTGIDSPYEKPLLPEIQVRTDICSVEEACEMIFAYLVKHHYIVECHRNEMEQKPEKLSPFYPKVYSDAERELNAYIRKYHPEWSCKEIC